MLSPFTFLLAIGAATQPPQCVPVAGDAHAVLEAAAVAIGLRSAAASRVLHLQGFDVESQDYQSDRTYPPYLSMVAGFDTWFSPASGVERTATRLTIAGRSGDGPRTLSSATATYMLRDSLLVPNEQMHTEQFLTRPLNVWSVLHDWLETGGARVVARCPYSDYARLVLSRQGPQGEERLFVNERHKFPVKLDRIEPHYLWGQIHVEYVYATWQRLDDVYIPGVSFRVVDGRTVIERVLGATRIVAADSAPSLTVPTRQTPMGYPIAEFMKPTAPDTQRIGPNAFLLANPGYREMVALARDTVFVLDATQGAERAQQDSAWIGKLFPGRHPVSVVVTDLAWPHVAGVRYWVAHGATLVAHRAARSFLESVVSRRWTRAPDDLERHRSRVHLRIVGVADTLSLAGGDLLVFAIDGRTSEVALGAFSRVERFLWASDFVQTLQQPTAYLDDVWSAVSRVGVLPTRLAAEHLALSDWITADRLARRSR